MRCAQVERLIDRYVDGRLTSPLAGRVRAHLRRCERCRELEAQASALLHGLRLPSAHAPAGFTAQVMQEVYRAEREASVRVAPPRAGGRLYRRLGYSFVATAAILLASLLVPRLAYPNLIRPDLLAAQLEAGRPTAVARIIDDAGSGLREVVRPLSAGMTGKGGYTR